MNLLGRGSVLQLVAMMRRPKMRSMREHIRGELATGGPPKASVAVVGPASLVMINPMGVLFP